MSFDLELADARLHLAGQPVTQTEPGILAAGTSTTLRLTEDRAALDLTVTAMQPRRFVRYEPVVAEDLGDLVGSYWSEELQTRYDVEEADGRLALLQREHGRLPLSPTVADSFTGTIPGLVPLPFAAAFDRADDGMVTGFRLSMPRVDNVVVRRLPASRPPGR